MTFSEAGILDASWWTIRSVRYPECYRRGALESWKAKDVGSGCGRELDAWESNDRRAREYGCIDWSGMGCSLADF